VAKEVAIQHHLRMDIWSSSARTKVEQHDFKESLILNYERTSTLGDSHLRCMILNVDIPRQTVRASHIWKFCSGGNGLSDFGLPPTALGNFRNGFLLCSKIEEAFDSKRVCFLVNRLHQEELVLKVLDPNLRGEVVCQDSPNSPKETFHSIDGSVLRHPEGVFPFRRILDFHAKMAYKNAITKNWIAPDVMFDEFFDLSIDGSIPDLFIYDDVNDTASNV
jgi:hypothetical protein